MFILKTSYCCSPCPPRAAWDVEAHAMCPTCEDDGGIIPTTLEKRVHHNLQCWLLDSTLTLVVLGTPQACKFNGPGY